MATHKSALKRSRQTERKRKGNARVKSILKAQIKEVRKEIKEKDLDAAQKALGKAIPLIAKAASKGVIHRNNASRKISHLTKKVNTLKAVN